MPIPPVAPTLTRIATVRFAPDEYVTLQAEADDRGVSLSTLLRLAALNRQIPPPRVPAVDLKMVTAMSRIGVNLNQAVHTLNRWTHAEADEKKSRWETWRSSLKDLHALLKDLESRLLK